MHEGEVSTAIGLGLPSAAEEISARLIALSEAGFRHITGVTTQKQWSTFATQNRGRSRRWMGPQLTTCC